MYIDNEWATIIDKVFTATVTVTPLLYQPVNQALRSHPDGSPNFQFPLSNRFLYRQPAALGESLVGPRSGFCRRRCRCRCCPIADPPVI